MNNAEVLNTIESNFELSEEQLDNINGAEMGWFEETLRGAALVTVFTLTIPELLVAAAVDGIMGGDIAMEEHTRKLRIIGG